MHKPQDEITIATIAGEIDLSNAAEIGDNLTDLPNLASGLIVDLHHTSYLDSTGIALLYDLALRLHQRSQQLIVVCPPSAAPRRVLELTGLHTHITLVDEISQGITLLQQATAPES